MWLLCSSPKLRCRLILFLLVTAVLKRTSSFCVKVMDKLGIDAGTNIRVRLVPTLPKATMVRLQPLSDSFALEVDQPQHVYVVWLRAFVHHAVCDLFGVVLCLFVVVVWQLLTVVAHAAVLNKRSTCIRVCLSVTPFHYGTVTESMRCGWSLCNLLMLSALLTRT